MSIVDDIKDLLHSDSEPKLLKPELYLKRAVEVSGSGTFGIITEDDKTICFTLELPDLDNERNISCIPCGVYNVERHVSPSKGLCFEVEGVNDRDDILIHKGNWCADSQGCIIVGRYSGMIQGKLGVGTSKKTMDMLLDRYKKGFTLVIE